MIREYGFWEVETPSLKDFPRGFRRFEIGRNSDNNLSIFVINVDTANPLGGGSSPSLISRSYSIGATADIPKVRCSRDLVWTPIPVFTMRSLSYNWVN